MQDNETVQPKESGRKTRGRIDLGDCIKVMANWPSDSIDLVVTDPPYLVNYKDRANRSIANDKTDEWLAPAFEQVYRVLKPHSFCVSFYGYTKTDVFWEAWKRAGFRIAGHFTFPKRYTSSTRFVKMQHEGAYLLTKGNPAPPTNIIGDVLEFQYSGNKHHPTQKPLGAIIPLVDSFSKPNDIVCDPFSGSGTTLVAAKMLGRRYLGIELDEKYHAAATARLGDYIIIHD